jgi:hypothetical protein
MNKNKKLYTLLQELNPNVRGIYNLTPEQDVHEFDFTKKRLKYKEFNKEQKEWYDDKEKHLICDEYMNNANFIVRIDHNRADIKHLNKKNNNINENKNDERININAIANADLDSIANAELDAIANADLDAIANAELDAKPIDINEDNISLKDIFSLVKELLHKNNLLEKKVDGLQKLLDIQKLLLVNNNNNNNNNKTITKPKLSIIDLLNSSSSSSPLFSFNINDFVLTRKHLNIIFENKNVLEGYVLLIIDLLTQHETLYGNKIVRAFNQEVNTLYIYSLSDLDANANANANAHCKWSIWTNKQISIFINKINSKLINEFLNWKNEKSKLMKSDESLADFYANQGIKIMGNTILSEPLCKKLYLHLKTDVNLLS